LKVGKSASLKIISLLILLLFAIAPLVAAQTPPYLYGAGGQWTEGNGSVYTTQLALNTGKFTNMLGTAGAAGLVTLGRADNWGYMGIEFTASESGNLNAYTYVKYYGHVQQYAIIEWIGYAESHVWVWQKITIIDVTAGYQTVGESTTWVYDQGVSGIGSKSKDFNENYYSSVAVSCVSGHTYRVQVSIELQSAAQAALGGVAQASHTFAGDYYVQINSINWYIA